MGRKHENVVVETVGQIPSGKWLYEKLIELYADQMGITIEAEVIQLPKKDSDGKTA
jgi:hypothetical protein